MRSYRTRLVFGYLVVILVFILLGLVGVYQIGLLVSGGLELDAQTRIGLAARNLSDAVLELTITLDENILSENSAQFSAALAPAVQNLELQMDILQGLIPETAAIDASIAHLVSYLEPMENQAANGDWQGLKRNRAVGYADAAKRVSEEIDKVSAQASAVQTVARDTLVRNRLSTLRSLGLFIFVSLVGLFFAGWVVLSGLMKRLHLLTTAVERLASGSLDVYVEPGSHDEIGKLSDAFNRMSAQLHAQYEQQESRIAERTAELEMTSYQLQTSSDVAHVATTMLDPQALLAKVVDLISTRFGFYHTGIFLVDESGRVAVLRAASSQGGKRMLDRGHRLILGQGVVGYAILQGKAHIAIDTGQDAVYFNNPDLPGTRSEVALPMRARGKVIGALDVQSMEVQAFSETNTTILQTLADQVALALDNARLYQESQERLEEVRRLYGEYGQQAWKELAEKSAARGYRYTPYQGVTPTTRVEIHAAEPDRPSPDRRQLALPLRVREIQVGMLNVRKPDGSGEWTTAEIEMLQTIVEQLGVALEGARLYGETQRRAEHERLLGSVSSQIRETLDMNTVLRTAAQQIRESLGLPEVTVRLAPQDHSWSQK